MGEDCLNERNNDQLTPAGLGIKVSCHVLGPAPGRYQWRNGGAFSKVELDKAIALVHSDDGHSPSYKGMRKAAFYRSKPPLLHMEHFLTAFFYVNTMTRQECISTISGSTGRPI